MHVSSILFKSYPKFNYLKTYGIYNIQLLQLILNMTTIIMYMIIFFNQTCIPLYQHEVAHNIIQRNAYDKRIIDNIRMGLRFRRQYCGVILIFFFFFVQKKNNDLAIQRVYIYTASKKKKTFRDIIFQHHPQVHSLLNEILMARVFTLYLHRVLLNVVRKFAVYNRYSTDDR